MLRKNAPSKGPDLLHLIGCSIAAPVLGIAQATNHTAGVGIGGSGGAGAGILGIFGALGMQVVADPQGNTGLTINGSFSFTGIGMAAQGGLQFSASTAKNIYQLSGTSVDLSGSVGIIGVDASHTPGGATTVTATIGPGVGARASGMFGASGTGILTSTNCQDMFPK